MAETLKKGTRVTGSDRSKLAADLKRRYDAGESIRSLGAQLHPGLAQHPVHEPVRSCAAGAAPPGASPRPSADRPVRALPVRAVVSLQARRGDPVWPAIHRCPTTRG